MSPKTIRSFAFLLVCVVWLGAYVYLRRLRTPSADAPVTHALTSAAQVSGSQHTALLTIDELQRAPHVVYRSARAREFGQLVVASLARPEAERAITQLQCERAHADRRGGVCLTYDRDELIPNFRALLFDGAFGITRTIAMPGFPSRTQLSSDGRRAAVTVFTTGDSYDTEFSTRTTVLDRTNDTVLPDLEQFSVTKDGVPFKRVDFNFWGITFTANSERFFATLSTKGATYLVSGNLSERSMRVERENVECPSLSPDGKHLAFKRRDRERSITQLYVLDTTSWQEFPVPGEPRHIDDQAAWLDDSHVLYGVTTAGAPEQALNVWVASIVAGGEPPRVFLTGASSPSVVR